MRMHKEKQIQLSPGAFMYKHNFPHNIFKKGLNLHCKCNHNILQQVLLSLHYNSQKQIN